MSRLRRWFDTIGGRFVIVAVVIVLVTTALATVVGSMAVTRIDDANGRHTLRVLADAAADDLRAQAAADAQLGDAKRQAALLTALDRPTLSRLRIRVASVVLVQGSPAVKGNVLARTSLSSAQTDQVLAGRSLSTRTTVDGDDVLVEARPVPGGAIVLAQRARDAATLVGQWLPRLLGLMALVAAAGALLALVMALRVARPLRTLAGATAELAAGRREVELPTGGPTEVQVLATEIGELTSALGRSEGRQREFLLSVSHDLRTPLTTITGYAEGLADGDIAPEEVATTGAIVLGEAHRLERMVSDLLVLARLEADEIRLDPRPVELGSLLREVRASWRAAAERADVTLGGEPPRPGTPGLWVNVDAERLRQAIDALLDNAIRVSGPGSSVDVTVHAADGQAVIEMRDDGPGLAPEDLPVAFEQGVLRERYLGRRPVGAGLGLAIVRRIIDRSGGRVEAAEGNDGGAIFRILLPLVDGPT